MNEELGYVLETIRFKTSIYRDKKKRNLSFNDDDYYSNILNEYITDLQQENKQLKDNWNKLKEIVKSQSDFKLKVRNKEVWFEIDELLSKMEELEKGVNND